MAAPVDDVVFRNCLRFILIPPEMSDKLPACLTLAICTFDLILATRISVANPVRDDPSIETRVEDI